MAESVVVADNVELVANNIQNKVGSSLVGLKSAAEETAQGINQGSLGVLDSIRTLQQKTVDKVHSVWEILKSQFDFEKDEARRAREDSKDIALGIKGKKGEGAGASGLEKATEDAAGSMGQRMMDMAMGAGATLFSVAGLTKIAGKIFKVGLVFMLAGYLGDALVDHFDIEEGATKDALQKGLPAAAALVALMGFKKSLLIIIPAIVAMGFASVMEWLKGDKLASEVSGFSWGSVALTGPALLWLGKLATGKTFATLAALAGGWPIVIAGSLAIAFAAGIGYLHSKVVKTEQMMLDHLGEMTDLSQAEFERRLEEQKTGFIASIAPGLAKTFGMDTTQLQDAFMATKAAKRIVQTKGGKLEDTEVQNIVSSVDMFAQIDEPTLKALLDDKDKADELMRSIHNMYQIAQSGQLGEHSAIVIKQLAGLSQNIQQTAATMMVEKEKSGETGWFDGLGYLQNIASDDLSGAKGGDVFERYADILANPEYKAASIEAEKIESAPRYQELKKKGFDEMTSKERQEWKALQWELQKQTGIMNRVGYSEMGQMGGLQGDVKMMDMLKLLTPTEQAQLLEQALSDKKVLLKANKLLEKDSNWQGGTTNNNMDASKNVVSTVKSVNTIAGHPIFEVDQSLQRALEANK